MNSLETDQLLELVIIPTLKYLNMDSPAAQNLLLGTAAHESAMGRYIKQIRGPALGIYQVEPATHDDIWINYLKYRPELAAKVRSLIPAFDGDIPPAENMIWDLRYATANARICYWRISEPLPDANDIPAMADYWDVHYNANPHKGFPHEFVAAYERYVKNV